MKLTPAGAKKKAWQAFARYIRSRDPFCVTCGAPTTEAGHYKHTTDKGTTKTLGGNELWFDERNVNGQCGVCNRWHSGRLDAYALYLEKTYGPGILQELQRKFNIPRKWTMDEMLAIAEKYNNLCDTSANNVSSLVE